MKCFMRIVLIMCVSVLSMTMVQGQYTVRGALKDGKTGEWLSYVNVVLLQAQDSVFVSGAVSNDSGVYVIGNVAAGDYILRASVLNYTTYYQNITVSANVDAGVALLSTKASTLQGITVTAERPLYSMDGEKQLYNVSDDPGVQSGTAADALQNAPGVEVDVEGNITLRGVSSVDIWINGHPSNLTGETLKQYIKQLPANTLETIEVITNPSARYKTKSDAVINLVTNAKIKRNELFCFGVRANSTPNISPWISYAWSNEKFSINAYAGYNYSGRKNQDTGYSLLYDNNQTLSQEQHYKGNSQSNSHSPNMFLSMNYTIDSMNTWSMYMGAYPSWTNSRSSRDMQWNEYIYASGDYSYKYTNAYSSFFGGGYLGSWYSHDFNQEGHSISVSLNANMGFNSSNGSQDRAYTIFTDKSYSKHNYGKGNNYSVGMDVDYVYPYSSKGEISVGISGEIGGDNSLNRYDTLNKSTDDDYVTDSLRSKQTKTNTQGAEAYVTWQRKMGNFTLKLGLRMDYMHTYMAYPVLPQYNFYTNYVNWRPSVHLSYYTKNMHNLHLSYTFRTSNPSANDVTRYITYNDDDFSTGNPYLKNVYKHQLEAGWTKYFKRFGSVGVNVYYNNSQNNISSLTDVAYNEVFDRLVTYSKKVNVGHSYQAGGDVTLTYRPKDFINLRFNANLYNNYYKAEIRPGEIVERNTFTYRLRLNFRAKFCKHFEAFLSANYRSKNRNLISTTHPYYSIDAGLSADFFKRRLSVYVNVNDIFNWNVNNNSTSSDYMESYSSSKNTTRFISAGVTLRLGKIELESITRQNTGSGESVE